VVDHLVRPTEVTLKDALANVTPGDRLLLLPGTYRGNFCLTRSCALVARDGLGSVTLEGSGGSVLTVSDDCEEAVIEGLFIRYGSAPYGGGVAVMRPALVRATDCVISHNVADYYGGGGLFARAGRVEIDRCRFTGNRAKWGGAMLLGTNVEAEVRNSGFGDNTALLGGGALRVADGGRRRFVFCTFANNVAPKGPCVFAAGTTTDQAEVAFVNTLFGGLRRDMGLHVERGRVWLSHCVVPAPIEALRDIGGESLVVALVDVETGGRRPFAPKLPAVVEGKADPTETRPGERGLFGKPRRAPDIGCLGVS